MCWDQACLLERHAPHGGDNGREQGEADRARERPALRPWRRGELGKAHFDSKGQTQGSVLGSLTPVPVLMATSLGCLSAWGGHGAGQSRRRVLADGM